MSYLALYRQFRPKTFDEIIGQEHVVKTLINQINTGRVGHAYLFCGARGTGKTTAAKVFARAINCLSPNNGSPCGQCEACKKLESPSNLDILEMDAASNNKVENVRDIRDKIQYPPVAGRYKVYIIDEVHMLTTEAFNALLKTLEEPPSHAVFILATTEVHKIPATILSRCLRFDFKLISTAKIAQFICEIYDKVGKKHQKEAVSLIAKAGEGSVRDALSIADICLSYSEGELTYDDVLEVLGTSDRAVIEQLIGAMFEGKTGEMLSLTDELLMRGKSVSILNRDVASALRDILVIKTCSNASEVLGIPEDKLAELEKLSQKTDVHALLRAIEIFSVAEADLKYSTHPKIVFETAAVKASLPQADYNIDALLARISALENKIASGAIAVTQTPSIAQTQAPEVAKAPSVKQSEAVEVKTVAPTATISQTEKKKEEVKTVQQTAIETKPEVKVEAKVEEKVELEQKQVEQVPSKAEKPVKNPPAVEVDEDLASLMALADQGGFFADEDQGSFTFSAPVETKKSGNKSINGTLSGETSKKSQPETVAKPTVEEKTLPNESTGDKSAVVSADKAWGAILRRLRQEKEIMLWVACQDVEVKANGKILLIFAPGENEYNLLSKQENVTKLNSCAFEHGYDNVQVVKDESQELKQTEEEQEVEQVQNLLMGENLTIKE